jgi:murein DD-endopeptidase MepM/ murein hydrolase activator NlpD
MRKWRKNNGIVACLLAVVMAFPLYTYAESQEVQELRNSIQERLAERRELERKAAELQEQLEAIGSQKSTLSSELSAIQKERASLENTIAQTEKNIEVLELEIDESKQLLGELSVEITEYKQSIKESLRNIQYQNELSYLEFILSSENISEFFRRSELLMSIQNPINEAVDKLYDLQNLVVAEAEALSEERKDLDLEKTKLDGQKKVVVSQESHQETLLNQTKNTESNYQQNLKATLATIDALDQEIRSFENQLDFVLNPKSIPKKGSAVMSWPLDSVLITQRFGRTVSSERLYVSGSHSGNDFRAAIGTPVYAVADGIVKGIGDTDKTCYRASFGKWVFIEHEGIGLSTTSAHLSGFAVSEGQRVKTGDLIGYAGNTGRSTAPHLHLTVYATEGVDGGAGARITERPSGACAGAVYRMPLAPTAAYLDPLDFLPPTNASMFKHQALMQ